MELKNKNVVITGASSGIGLEILKLLLENGCRVAACRPIAVIRVDPFEITFPKAEVKKISDAETRM